MRRHRARRDWIDMSCSMRCSAHRCTSEDQCSAVKEPHGCRTVSEQGGVVPQVRATACNSTQHCRTFRFRHTSIGIHARPSVTSVNDNTLPIGGLQRYPCCVSTGVRVQHELVIPVRLRKDRRDGISAPSKQRRQLIAPPRTESPCVARDSMQTVCHFRSLVSGAAKSLCLGTNSRKYSVMAPNARGCFTFAGDDS